MVCHSSAAGFSLAAPYVDGSVQNTVGPMDVNINNYGSSKEHLVYYVLRDEFSGNFIFDVPAHVADSLPFFTLCLEAGQG